MGRPYLWLQVSLKLPFGCATTWKGTEEINLVNGTMRKARHQLGWYFSLLFETAMRWIWRTYVPQARGCVSSVPDSPIYYQLLLFGIVDDDDNYCWWINKRNEIYIDVLSCKPISKTENDSVEVEPWLWRTKGDDPCLYYFACSMISKNSLKYHLYGQLFQSLTSWWRILITSSLQIRSKNIKIDHVYDSAATWKIIKTKLYFYFLCIFIGTLLEFIPIKRTIDCEGLKGDDPCLTFLLDLVNTLKMKRILQCGQVQTWHHDEESWHHVFIQIKAKILIYNIRHVWTLATWKIIKTKQYFYFSWSL